MKIIKTQIVESFVLVLEIGEEIVESLLTFCQQHKIEAAWLSGIGALSEATLALYDLDKKEYHQQTIGKALEISALSGNITTLDGKLTAHVHVVLSDAELQAYGGHLLKATVAATCEIRIDKYESSIKRQYNDNIGLNLIVEKL